MVIGRGLTKIRSGYCELALSCSPWRAGRGSDCLLDKFCFIPRVVHQYIVF